MHLARHERPSRLRSDKDGRVGLVTQPSVPGEVARSVFAAVERYGLGDEDVIRHLLFAVVAVAAEGPREGRAALEALGASIRAEAAKAAPAFDEPGPGRHGG